MRKAILLALVAGLAAGCGSAARPHFGAAHGWRVIAEPGQIVSAANVAFAAADRSQSAPIHTVGSLPKRGIVIWVQSDRRGRHPSTRPLRVQDMTATRVEGFVCPGAIRAIQTSGRGWNVYVWVFFGAAHPRLSSIAAANAELARLSF